MTIETNREVVELLDKLINEEKRDIMIKGSIHSGKTTLLNNIVPLIKDNIIKIDEKYDRKYLDIQEEMTISKIAGFESILVVDGLEKCKVQFNRVMQEIKLNNQIQRFIVTGHII